MSETRPPDIPLYEPHLGGNERAYLDECVRTNFVSSVGPFVERFEQDFARYVGAKHAVACSTGTAAIHVALRLLEVEPGDEVIVPTLTFIASANPIVYEKAVPLLADVDASTYNLDPQPIVDELAARARAGKKQPKAVMAVHILGHPGEIEPLVEACERHGVALIEDAAEALGARYTTGKYAGRQVGTIGSIGCFSFNGNKIITSGGGGMITTDDPVFARRAKHLTTQARLPGPEYRHDEVGYNYRLTNLAAALGVAQLEQLPSFLATKSAAASRYDKLLEGLVDLPPRAPWAQPTHWLYTVGLRGAADRREVWKRLTAEGLHTRPIWTPLHLLEPYAKAPRLGGNVAERLFERALSLPSSVTLRPEDQVRVADALRAVLS